MVLTSDSASVVFIALMLGLTLFAVAAAHSLRVRRIETALNVEFVIRDDVLDPNAPRARYDSGPRTPLAKGTSTGAAARRDRCDFH